MTTPETVQQSITLLGQEIPVKNAFLLQTDLRFYPENPRIYSIVHAGTESPTQKDIEERLQKQEHVIRLVQAIKAHGGLINPLIVRDGDYVVLEGNSRLAAFRLLAKGDPIRWGRVKCTLLPEDIDEDLIDAFLGQIHIIGQKDWAPFEQAGYLWRRCKTHGVSAEKIGREMGISVRTINRLVDIYQFMVDHGEEDPQRWSYYEEYLKSRKVQKQRNEHPELDRIIVKKIRSGEISKAVDVRDKVVKIVTVGGKPLNKFIKQNNSLESCYTSAIERGANSATLKNIEKFKQIICDPDTKTEILNDMNSSQQRKCKFHLVKIQQATTRILNKIPTKY